MKKSLFIIVLLCASIVAKGEDFYLPLVGYLKYDKESKNIEEVKHAGVCCLEGADMFVYINKLKVECISIENIEFKELTNNTSHLSTMANVTFNCGETIQMKVVLNFVNKNLTNIYLLGEKEDYEFYLGDI